MKKTTPDPCFDRADIAPDENAMKSILGAQYHPYELLMALVQSCPREWKFYGKKYGWQLKVALKGKALFYLVPMEGAFRLGLAVRENERDELLRSSLPEPMKEELKAATKVMEGYPLRLIVTKKSDMKAVRLVVELLTSARV